MKFDTGGILLKFVQRKNVFRNRTVVEINITQTSCQIRFIFLSRRTDFETTEEQRTDKPELL